MERIKARIETSNNDILLGTLDSGSQRFVFPHPFKYVKDRLLIRDFIEEGAIVSYIYEDDYEPKVMLVKKDQPLVIKDYKGYKLYKIIIEIEE
ncbi:MAG: hypothetical protein IJQ67_02165 [Bacilli bacterium]|nr:hypothetical protein [Bacilli bacterium]